MDALTLATSFATIIGLLSSYTAGRESADLASFMQSLKESNQEDIIKLIEQNNDIKVQLEVLMSQSHDKIMLKLQLLNNLTMSVAGQIEGLKGFADSFKVENGLSEQAVNILRQFVNSGGEHIWRTQTLGDGPDYSIDVSEPIKINEPRFIEDDLEVLTRLSLLSFDITSNGYHRYRITRQAVNFIETIDANKCD